MRVKLSESELQSARERGQRLAEVNRTTPDTPAYADQSRKVYQDEAEAGFVMSVAECAVAKATGKAYHGKVWPASEHALHKHEADVGEHIEVRHVTKPNAGLVVREKDLGRGKFLFLAYPDPATGYSEVEVVGWMRAEDAWAAGFPQGDYRRVPQTKLSTRGMVSHDGE